MASSSWVAAAAVCVCLMVCATVVADEAPRIGSSRTLVVLDDPVLQSSHSAFLQTLRDRGHVLDVRLASDNKVQLSRYGDWIYDNLVLFAPSTEEPCGLLVEEVMAFVDGGGSALVAASDQVSDFIQDVAGECGVEFDEAGSSVVDHLSHDVSDPGHDHTLVVAHVTALARPVIAGDLAPEDRVVFRGVGLAFDPENLLATKVLTGTRTAYSAFLDEPIKEYPQSTGFETVLVAAVQARNNARVTFAGSLYMFSNAAFTAQVVMPSDDGGEGVPSANSRLCAAVAAWTFQQSGVLRVSSVSHQRADGSRAERQLANQVHDDLPKSMFPEPEIAPQSLVYRIRDHLVYTIDIQEYNGTAWRGFAADDVQLEFVMLDPYVRVTMEDRGDGRFVAEFQAPDVYGVFKFRVVYRRPGWSNLESHTQVTLRPYKHNEYERFIEGAFPYYASAFAMMAGVFIFSFVFLYSRDV